jgi:hypothetical protein
MLSLLVVVINNTVFHPRKFQLSHKHLYGEKVCELVVTLLVVMAQDKNPSCHAQASTWYQGFFPKE